MAADRIQKIVSAIPVCDTLADVGCDHGFVGIGALVHGLAKRVRFVDVSAPSLAKARQNLSDKFADKADFTCRDGLGDIVADCAVIAGMGGLETISVLEGAAHLPQNLVLQPMRNQPDVRRWLTAHGYGIRSDKMFKSAGKYYDLIVAQKGFADVYLTETEILFGKDNIREKNEDFAQYILRKKNDLEKILKNTDDQAVTARYGQVCAAVEAISEDTK